MNAQDCVAPARIIGCQTSHAIFDSPCGSSPFNFYCLLQSTLVFCLVLCLALLQLIFFAVVPIATTHQVVLFLLLCFVRQSELCGPQWSHGNVRLKHLAQMKILEPVL